MLTTIPVKRLMTTKVKTVRENDVMTVVNDIFSLHKFNHIPVLDEQDHLVGMMSRKDFNKILTTFSIFNTQKAEAENRRLQKSILVKDVMSSDVLTLQPEDQISIAYEIFKENLIHALPVVDDNRKIIGIITTHDLLTYAFEKK